MRAMLVLGLAGALPMAARAQAPAEPASVSATLVRTLPHDPAAYTEGLFIDQGVLFESTGQWGRSGLRRVDLATGRVIAQTLLAANLFGEGIAPWHGTIISLTWRNGVGFRWSRDGLHLLGRFAFLGEGWALTVARDPREERGGERLVMSDGSSTLRFIDPATFRVTRLLPVTVAGRALPMLNELEAVDGEILANIWLTDRIARIDPADGHVIGFIDLSALHRRAGAFGQDQVANGIAWDKAHRRLYVTGKEWPVMFEIVPPKGR